MSFKKITSKEWSKYQASDTKKEILKENKYFSKDSSSQELHYAYITFLNCNGLYLDWIEDGIEKQYDENVLMGFWSDWLIDNF